LEAAIRLEPFGGLCYITVSSFYRNTVKIRGGPAAVTGDRRLKGLVLLSNAASHWVENNLGRPGGLIDPKARRPGEQALIGPEAGRR